MVFGQNGQLGSHAHLVVVVGYSGGTGPVREGHMVEKTVLETGNRNSIAINILVLVTKSSSGLQHRKNLKCSENTVLKLIYR